jgi:hypothetical protein
MEPLYQGEPILAAPATVDEDSLRGWAVKKSDDLGLLWWMQSEARPGGSNWRGSFLGSGPAAAAWVRRHKSSPAHDWQVKWTRGFRQREGRSIADGQDPSRWSYGDLNAAFKIALVWTKPLSARHPATSARNPHRNILMETASPVYTGTQAQRRQCRQSRDG